MKTRFTVSMIGMACLLLFAGIAGAQPYQAYTVQTLLPGSLIPKFIDPLPVGSGPDGTGITVLDATVANTGTPPNDYHAYDITMAEFQAQILPNVAIPITPSGKRGSGLTLPAGTASWVWGYLTDADLAAGGVRQSYLGPVVVAKRGVETRPTYINSLPNPLNNEVARVQPLLPVDMTLDWADPLNIACFGENPGVLPCGFIYKGPQPAVPHIHGGEVAPAYDGGPDAWWTPGVAQNGAGFSDTTFIYPNEQQAGTIWFHDHALGITRLNVYAGLAGLYPIIDPPNEPPQAGATCAAGGCLPNAKFDIPLIIQDRSFDTAGQLYYNLASNPQPNPLVHPYWIPEFIGDTIVVNGKTWPFLAVEPRMYRFRIVNGSNARFYDLTLNYRPAGNSGKPAVLPFTVIATDDGYLNAPVVPVTNNLIIGPGERYEIIVNFADPLLPANAFITMMNAARTPFPGGAKPVTGTTDTVMQFQVTLPLDNTIVDATLPTTPASNPLRPNNPIVWIRDFANFVIKRQLTLNEVIGPGGPLELVLNNTKFNGVIPPFGSRESEIPAVGDTELWEIINITADAHPIHTHLASFQVVDRQPFDAAAYTTAYVAAFPAGIINPDGVGPPNVYNVLNTDGAIGGNPAIGPFLFQANRRRTPVATIPVQPLAYEMGWKDTAISYPGEVMRIMIRWSPTEVQLPGTGTPCTAGNPLPTCDSSSGVNLYPIADAELIGGYGYVWHCHIIDHEDNEMMRPYKVGAVRQAICPSGGCP